MPVEHGTQSSSGMDLYSPAEHLATIFYSPVDVALLDMKRFLNYGYLSNNSKHGIKSFIA